jgi:hypothetical protein
MTQSIGNKALSLFSPLANSGIIPNADSLTQAQSVTGSQSLIGNIAAEGVLGSGCGDPMFYVCDKARLLPTAFANRPYIVDNYDFASVGPVGQLRAALERLYAGGRTVPFTTPLPTVGINKQAAFASDDPLAPWNGRFPLSVGFRLSWGISTQNFVPFTMQIQSSGFENEDGSPIDRDVSVIIDEPAGSSIWIPWANRISPPMSLGCVQVGRPVPQEDAANVATITIVNVDATILPNLSASVQFLTAFTPATAALVALAGAYGNTV